MFLVGLAECTMVMLLVGPWWHEVVTTCHIITYNISAKPIMMMMEDTNECKND